MRIRKVGTEHFMMDIQGMFYELQPLALENHIWGVKPICQHLRTISDYCSFRGLLAIGGNESRRPMLGFKSFASAANVINEIELLRHIHKRQFALNRLLRKGQTAPAIWNAMLAA
jgi:hypothetical protein